MLKIACVFSFKTSHWVSCQKIVLNLHKAYEKCPGTKLTNHNFSANPTPHSLKVLAREIHSASPDIITFLDHAPHPLKLLSELLPLYQERKKPKIVFHVYGDFTLHYPSWEKASHLLRGFPVEFIVPSERQKAMFDRLIFPLKASLCPFPVDGEEFSYQKELRQKQRAAWGLPNNAKAFVFTGRLSRQKNIHALIHLFHEELALENKAHLYLYGNADAIGDPFLNRYEFEGEYFRHLDRIYQSLPASLKKRIHFMGPVPNQDLKAVYHGADVLINLSVHNDEDFGMSVAEAKASGLECILSDWGGLAGFEHSSLPEATTYVRVKIGKKSKLISKRDARVALRSHFEKKKKVDPQRLSELTLKKFGVNACASLLSEILFKRSSAFTSFSPLFDKVQEESIKVPFTYVDTEWNIKKIFRDIYSAYVRHP